MEQKIKCTCPECGSINTVRIEHPEQGAACPECSRVYRAIEHQTSKEAEKMSARNSVHPFFTASVRASNPYKHQTEIVSANHFPTLEKAENFLKGKDFLPREILDIITATKYAVIVRQTSPTTSTPEGFYQ